MDLYRTYDVGLLTQGVHRGLEMKGVRDLQRRVVLVVLGLQLLEVGRAEALRFVHVARKVSACQPRVR